MRTDTPQAHETQASLEQHILPHIRTNKDTHMQQTRTTKRTPFTRKDGNSSAQICAHDRTKKIMKVSRKVQERIRNE